MQVDAAAPAQSPLESSILWINFLALEVVRPFYPPPMPQVVVNACYAAASAACRCAIATPQSAERMGLITGMATNAAISAMGSLLDGNSTPVIVQMCAWIGMTASFLVTAPESCGQQSSAGEARSEEEEEVAKKRKAGSEEEGVTKKRVKRHCRAVLYERTNNWVKDNNGLKYTDALCEEFGSKVKSYDERRLILEITEKEEKKAFVKTIEETFLNTYRPFKVQNQGNMPLIREAQEWAIREFLLDEKKEWKEEWGAYPSKNGFTPVKALVKSLDWNGVVAMFPNSEDKRMQWGQLKKSTEWTFFIRKGL